MKTKAESVRRTDRAKHHLDLDRKHLREGKDLLVKGDPVQASEKLWVPRLR